MVLNYNSGNFSTVSSKDIEAEYISVDGGINLSSELSKEEFKISKAINEEQVIIFNPDVIVASSRQSADAIAKTRRLPSQKSYGRGKFSSCLRLYSWSVRSAKGALYPLWLGKTPYPEKFAGLNLQDEAKKFYLKFYNYELSDEEAKAILNPRL